MSSATRVALPETEVDARVLRRQIARARVHFLHEGAAVGEGRGDEGARREARQPHLEPVARRARVPEQEQRAADRVDGDVHATVVVEVGCSEAASVHAQALVEAGVDEAAAPRHEDLDALRVLRAGE